MRVRIMNGALKIARESDQSSRLTRFGKGKGPSRFYTQPEL
jgi:hypothetical protein